MSSFDGWETRLCGDAMALPAWQLSGNELMHFRTKGSKNGVRRYQNADGTWTPLGLKERREREGWGDEKVIMRPRAERKADRAAAKEKRQAVRSERKAQRAAVKQERRNLLQQNRKKNDLSELSDAELKRRIERVKMEQEYKELTKSPLVKTGETLVMNYLANRAVKAERAYQNKQESIKYARDMLKLKEETKQKELQLKSDEKRYAADQARAEADKQRALTDKVDIEKGTRAMKLKNERKNLKLQGKRFVSDNTIRGGLKKGANAVLSARGEGRAERIKERSFVSGILRGKKRVDKYNRKLGEEEEKLMYDPDAWNRDKNRKVGGNKNNENKKNKKG